MRKKTQQELSDFITREVARQVAIQRRVEEIVDETVSDMAAKEANTADSESVAPLNKRAEILRTAEDLINGDRAQTYGPPKVSFRRIADIWNAQGYRRLVPQTPDPETYGSGMDVFYKAEKLDEVDTALILIGMKLSRTGGAREHEDNWVDLAGYAGLGAELAMPPEENASYLTIKFFWSKEFNLYICLSDGIHIDDHSIIAHMNHYHPKANRYETIPTKVSD